MPNSTKKIIIALLVIFITIIMFRSCADKTPEENGIYLITAPDSSGQGLALIGEVFMIDPNTSDEGIRWLAEEMITARGRFWAANGGNQARITFEQDHPKGYIDSFAAGSDQTSRREPSDD